jgi:hypothetical protein
MARRLTRSQPPPGAMEEEGRWLELPEIAFAKVLELLCWWGRPGWQTLGPRLLSLSFHARSAAVRGVCAAWRQAHDAQVTRLVLRRRTPDAAVESLVDRFPAVTVLRVAPPDWSDPYELAATLGDRGARAVGSLSALTVLELPCCFRLTDAGVAAVARGCTALEVLRLTGCVRVSDAGARAVAQALPALRTLDLGDRHPVRSGTGRGCCQVSDAGVTALARGCTALRHLSLRGSHEVSPTLTLTLTLTLGRARRGCRALTPNPNPNAKPNPNPNPGVGRELARAEPPARAHLPGPRPHARLPGDVRRRAGAARRHALDSPGDRSLRRLGWWIGRSRIYS